MSPTPTDPNQAQAWITGDPPDQTIDFYIPRGNTGPMGPQGPLGPSLLVGNVETVTGPAAPGTVGPQGLIGPKGDPGGLTAATNIDVATNLNSLLTPGIYQTAGGNVDTVRNYPITYNSPFVMVVYAGGSNTGIQVARFSYATRAGQVTYTRTWSGSGTIWTAWRSTTASRVDQTAGRVIYQWDDLNARDQLIYGDTGWRSIALDATYGVAAVGNYFGGPNGNALTADAIKIRRVGSTVMISNNGGLQPKQDYTNTTRNIIRVPIGFRSSGGNEHPICRYGNNGGDANQRLVFLGVGADYADPAYLTATPLLDPNWNNYAPGTTWPKIYGGIWVAGTWHTNDAWPTTLPGTALGTIPNT